MFRRSETREGPRRSRSPLGRHLGRLDLRTRVRLALGLLLAADLIAAAVVLKPWGGAEQMEGERLRLEQEVAQKQRSVAQLRAVAAKVETARQEAEQFVRTYFLDRRTVSSTVLGELDQLARLAGVRQKEGSYLFEPVEGSENLSLMTITVGYEATYPQLLELLNLLDRSPRLLIVSDLQAAPQSSGGALNVTIKLHAFVRESAPGEQAWAAPLREAARP